MFAVVLIPDFALQAALRHAPELRERPVALVDEKSARAKIAQLTDSARAAGVREGMTAPQALARCQSIVIKPRSAGDEAAAQDALLQCAFAHSPFVESTAPGVCVLALKSRARRACEPLIESLAQLGLRAQIGLAAHPDTALLAAHRARPLCVVERSRKFLAALPIESLAPQPCGSSIAQQRAAIADWGKTRAVLGKWGIRTAGAFLALGREQIAARLGPAGLAAWERAAPSRQRPLRLVQPPETFEEAMEFEHEIETLDPLLFILRRFLDQIALRLRAIHRVAAEITLRLEFSGGQEPHERLFKIPSPTGGADILFRMLHTHLENFRTESPIIALRLAATPAEPASQQFGLFETALRDPNQFAETLARLAALVGHDRVGTPVNDDTHRPDAFTMRPANFKIAIRNSKIEAPLGPALRRFRPPIPLERASLRIRARLGPWRSSGGWWDEKTWTREEWDIEASDGALYRISHQPDGSFLEAVYD